MRFLAILTIKNEAAFLLDWLAHHQAVGITDFLVFSNDCSDPTEAMLERLAELGVIIHQPNPGPHPQGPQWAALRAAQRHPILRAVDWIIALDIDEYINIHAADHRLGGLVAALPEAHAIALTWRLFGNCGVVQYQDIPVSAQFTHAAPAVMSWPWRAALFKTLFRNDGSYGKLGVHRPLGLTPGRAPRWFDGAGRPLPASYQTAGIFTQPGRDTYRLAQLNHYPLGAMESYLLKCDRGRANRDAAPFDMSYWVERNFCTVQDRSIESLAAPTAALRAALAADTTLARLHLDAVQWRHDRFAEVMLQESFRSLFGRLLLAPPSQPLRADAAGLMAQWGQRAAVAKAETMAPPQDN